MPVEVSIREIRKQLLVEAAGLAPGDGRVATIAELIGAFHDTVAALFSPTSPLVNGVAKMNPSPGMVRRSEKMKNQRLRAMILSTGALRSLEITLANAVQVR